MAFAATNVPGTIRATAKAGTIAGDAEPIPEATALQAHRPPAIPKGRPTRSANRVNDVACQATTAATCGRTKPIVFQDGEVPAPAPYGD